MDNVNVKMMDGVNYVGWRKQVALLWSVFSKHFFPFYCVERNVFGHLPFDRGMVHDTIEIQGSMSQRELWIARTMIYEFKGI